VKWIIAGLLLLSGCGSTPLDQQPGFDNYPLRTATASEGKKLKNCHKAIFAAEKEAKQKTGNYSSHVSKLGVDSDCGDMMVMVEPHPQGYLAVAKINKDNTTVRWLSDETGKIFEELDEAPDPNKMTPDDPDSDFGFGF
jgi:hypothetical protein